MKQQFLTAAAVLVAVTTVTACGVDGGNPAPAEPSEPTGSDSPSPSPTSTEQEEPTDKDGSGVADRSYGGMPEETSAESDAESTAPEDLASPEAIWLEEGMTFAVTIWGSSSCPQVPTQLDATSTDELSIEFEKSTDEVCTADLAPTTHEFTMPDDISAESVAVTITTEGEDEPAELQLD